MEPDKKKKGVLGWLADAVNEAAKVIDAPPKKAPVPARVLGAPVDPLGELPERKRLDELFNSLPPEKQMEVKIFLQENPFGRRLTPENTVQYGGIQLPWIETAVFSNIGGRKEHQDRALVNPIAGMQAVCDGMETKGGVAAEAAVGLISNYFSQGNEGAVLRASVRAKAKEDSLEARLQVLGQLIHAEIRSRIERTGGGKGGTTLAGTVIVDQKMYSFHKGDSMNVVIREGRVVFCTTPMSYLQKFVNRTAMILEGDLKARVDEWVQHSPLTLIHQILPELNHLSDKERIKKALHSDPGRVLGWAGDEADQVIVLEFDLKPGDTIVSMCDGATDALGMRVVPSLVDGRIFDVDYDKETVYGNAPDPLKELAGCTEGGLNQAKRTASNIIDLAAQHPTGDNVTIVVSQYEPHKYVPSTPSLSRSRATGGPSLPPAVPAPRPPSPLDRPTPSPGETTVPVIPLTPEPTRRSPLPLFPSEPPPLPEPPTIIRPRSPVALPPQPRWSPFPTDDNPFFDRSPELTSRPPLPSPEDSDPFGFIPLRPIPTSPEPPRIPLAPPPFTPRPAEPPPNPEILRKAADIARLEAAQKALAVEYDEHVRAGEELEADRTLAMIWDNENRLAVLKGEPKPKRDSAVERRLRLNGYRSEMIYANELVEAHDEGYQDALLDKDWTVALSVLFNRHEASLQLRKFSVLLAWEEGRFSDLMDQMVELRTKDKVETLKIVRMLPPDHPRTPNMVIAQVLDGAGKVQKQMALSVEQWQQKLEKGTEVLVTPELYPLKAEELMRQATLSLDWIRTEFRGTRVAQKLDAGEFNTRPDLRENYIALRELLAQPVSTNDIHGYITWVDKIETCYKRIRGLMKGN